MMIGIINSIGRFIVIRFYLNFLLLINSVVLRFIELDTKQLFEFINFLMAIEM
jgi:hypothetical protein